MPTGEDAWLAACMAHLEMRVQRLGVLLSVTGEGGGAASGGEGGGPAPVAPHPVTHSDLLTIHLRGGDKNAVTRHHHRVATTSRSNHYEFLQRIRDMPEERRAYSLRYFRGLKERRLPTAPHQHDWVPVVVDSRTGVVYRLAIRADEHECRWLVEAFHADGTPFPERNIPLPAGIDVACLRYATAMLLSEDGVCLGVVCPCNMPTDVPAFRQWILTYMLANDERPSVWPAPLVGASTNVAPAAPAIPEGMVQSLVEETAPKFRDPWAPNPRIQFPPTGGPALAAGHRVRAAFGNNYELHVLAQHVNGMSTKYTYNLTSGAVTAQHHCVLPVVAPPAHWETIGLMFDKVLQRCLAVRWLLGEDPDPTQAPKTRLELHVLAPQAPAVPVVWRCILRDPESFIGVFDAQNGRPPLLLTNYHDVQDEEVWARAITFPALLIPVNDPPAQDRQVLYHRFWASNRGLIRFAGIGGYGGVLCINDTGYDAPADHMVDISTLVTPALFKWPDEEAS